MQSYADKADAEYADWKDTGGKANNQPKTRTSAIAEALENYKIGGAFHPASLISHDEALEIATLITNALAHHERAAEQ